MVGFGGFFLWWLYMSVLGNVPLYRSIYLLLAFSIESFLGKIFVWPFHDILWLVLGDSFFDDCISIRLVMWHSTNWYTSLWQSPLKVFLVRFLFYLFLPFNGWFLWSLSLMIVSLYIHLAMSYSVDWYTSLWWSPLKDFLVKFLFHLILTF